jgi:uncharacterized protein (TIGR03118 family)
MQLLSGRNRLLSTLLGLVVVLASSAAFGQYSATYLTSNVSGKAAFTDPLLQNAWGIAYGPGGAFWVSDEADGWSTLYSATGQPQSLQVVVPPASGSGPGSPTGMVYNASSEFAIDSWVSVFLFATLDGTIQGWSSFNPGSTLIGVPASGGASYTGLAITSHASGNMIYAADFANNKVDVYDGTFSLVNSFTDPSVPAGFAPFGIQDIDGHVLVAYAAQNGGPGGVIDSFSESGALQKHLVTSKALNQPWGIALAPKNFGPLSNTLLVTNNVTNGTINGFNTKTGALVGTVSSAANTPIVINGIWGIIFGGGTTVNGQTNQLFFTSGPNDTFGGFGVVNAQ